MESVAYGKNYLELTKYTIMINILLPTIFLKKIARLRNYLRKRTERAARRRGSASAMRRRQTGATGLQYGRALPSDVTRIAEALDKACGSCENRRRTETESQKDVL